MIVFFKENDEYHNVFAIYWVDDKCYFILLSKINHALFPVSSDECEVIVNDLSNYVLAFKDCSKNLIIHNLIYKNTDIYQDFMDYYFSEAGRKLEKIYSDDTNHEYLRIEKLNLEKNGVIISAEALGDYWALCPKCNESFKVNNNHEIIVCPNDLCRTLMLNPYYKFT